FSLKQTVVSQPAGRGAGACRKNRGRPSRPGRRIGNSGRLRGEGTGRRNSSIGRRAHQCLPDPDPTKAEESFHTALAIAREQGTRGYELRAATSLARLWREQGWRGEARDLLAPVYGWFTEGFDTPDLTEAKALLDELG